MNEFERRTRNQRACNRIGRQPQQHVALWTDNCTSHSTPAQVQTLKERHNIHIRPLLENASHIQQQVDQHVGNTMKEDIKTQYFYYAEGIMDEMDNGTRAATDKITAKQRRAKIFEFAYKAAQRLKERKNLLEKSWINWGLYLPMDGSKDGDESTLHIDGKYKCIENDNDIDNNNDNDNTDNKQQDIDEQ